MNNPEIIVKNAPFKHFCMSIGAIPTSYKDSLDYYETLLYLIKYLEETVIPVVNNNGEAVSELQRLYIELKDFVDNYFDNLDVQEEINNKLDEMVEDGTLQEIIGEYLNANALWCFDTVEEMKNASNLIDGSYAKTLGYYSINDGGTALYKIREITNEDIDNDLIIPLENDNLVAELIVKNNTINIKQLGARSQDINNNKYDIKPYVEKYLEILKTYNKGIKLYIPSGVWHSSPLVLDNTNGFDIKGDEQFILHNNRGTLITSLNDNQNTIWTIGDGENFVTNFSLKNILFTTADYIYDSNDNIFKENSIKNINDVCLRINVAQFGDTDNLYFQHINGSALALTTCWEINYRKLFFRDINALNKGVFILEEVINSGGINASQFENIMFEQVIGDLIVVEHSARFENCVINNLNFEDYKITRTGITYTNINDDNKDEIEQNATHFNLIKLPTSGTQFHNIMINNIQLNNVACWYSSINNNNYVYDSIITTIGNYNLLGVIINNIDILGINKDIIMLYSHDNVDQGSSLIINNVYNRSKNRLKFDIDNFTYVKCDSRLYLSVPYVQRLNKNITPCYELVSNRTTGYRFLISDIDAINESGLCVKTYPNAAPFRFTVSSNKLYIRAKINNGEEYAIQLGGSHTQNETLTGTGNFEIYEITLADQWNIGDYIQIISKDTNTSDMIIDYFIN